MTTTSQIQTVTECGNSGTLLTKDGCLTHFLLPSSLNITLAAGDLVTCECICVPTEPPHAMAVIVSKP